jgi:hypothetical protein
MLIADDQAIIFLDIAQQPQALGEETADRSVVPRGRSRFYPGELPIVH